MKTCFAENLKNLRRSAGITQAQLANLVGVDQRTISAWENNVCQPDFETLSLLCEIFHEDFNGMLGEN